ncbi:MAG: L-glyceraldehyde 3-phosphate reductase [Lachnospiraceae bacterium]
MYQAQEDRYEKMQYLRCGRSGVCLPRVALGLWHNFGSVDSYENQRDMIHTAFDAGTTHFDLANNYGPNPGSAEENFGRIMEQDMRPYRDEMFISSKAGYTMWKGPYGDYGSRKYMISSLDQSLQRMKLDYVDVFYHHRPDPETPLEETMGALSDIVKQGKALYIGLSNYKSEQTRKAAAILQANGTPLLIHQPRYNMFSRWVEEDGLLDTLDEIGAGCICFSPLAQGLLTNRYLGGIPADSRAKKEHFLKSSDITEDKLRRIQQLDDVAKEREQSLAQMALAWVLRQNRVTTVLIGASRPSQITDSVQAIAHLDFTEAELKKIETILSE